METCQGVLPRTGASTFGLLVVACLLLLAGAVLVYVSRRSVGRVAAVLALAAFASCVVLGASSDAAEASCYDGPPSAEAPAAASTTAPAPTTVPPSSTSTTSTSTTSTSTTSTSTTSTSTTSTSTTSTTVPVVDTDGDRLADSVETNTGVFVSITNTGTDPRKADTDGDAIKDGDEVLGTTAGLDLAALGFRALHKDLAVEFDWYDDTAEPDACGAGTHSHRPAPDSIAEIATAYANAPVSNPDGTTGINFIADYGQGGVFVGGNFVPGPADGVIAADGVPGNSLAGEYNVVKNANFASSRNGYFHYLFSAHKNEGSDGSGGGELLGDDVLSVDGCYFSDHHDVANLVFHELGHNLSLRHGGFEDLNFKPNYNSVMNYGITGVDTNCDGIGDNVLGYSSGTNIDLDENALVEANGTCGPGHPIDWNKNGSIDAGPIAYNLNPEEGPGLTVLKDNDDWAQISFAGLTDAD